MLPDRWQRVQELFEAALSLPTEERASFLTRACCDETVLREEVEALLECDTQAGDEFLRPPDRDSVRRAAMVPPDALIGQRVGNYDVKSVIASGGMGTVYEALQHSPNRVVALKVMNRQPLSAAALRRFQFEAQILGRLRHPNIAQIYEAGVYGEGPAEVPYFAMEYVPAAQTITQYAIEGNLATRDRLLLFAKVCDAVNHGHQKAIIHRDLKPANILVDTAGEPKVIDFGVARTTDSDLAVTTQQTSIGQLIGTVQYMSPEQCDADPHELDIRTDVYSLGVVLYELLTGQLPYEASGTSLYRATHTIKEQIPRRPSAINPKLRGELEIIVLKAIEKERERRYRSAAELAEDIRRFLRGDPIAARPPSLTYLLNRYARRRPWQLTALALAILAIVLGSATVAVFARLRLREQSAALQIQKEAAAAADQMSRLRGAETALVANDPGGASRLLDEIPPAKRGWEWRHLVSRVDQSVAQLGKRDMRDARFAFDPQERYVAVACSPPRAQLELYSIADGAVAATFELGDREIKSLAFSHDGQTIAIASRRVAETAAQIGLYRAGVRGWEPCGGFHTKLAEIMSLAFHPTADILVGGSGVGPICVWRVETIPGQPADEPTAAERLVATLDGHTDEVLDLAFSPAGERLASAGQDWTVRVWDLDVAQQVGSASAAAVLCGHQYYVRAVAFHPDGQLLASAGADETVRVWDLKAALSRAEQHPRRFAAGPGVELHAFFGHDGPVRSVDFGPRGGWLVSGGDDRTVRVWDVALAGPVRNPDSLRYSLSAPRFLPVAALRGSESAVVGVHAMTDGRLLSVSDNGAVKFWWPDTEDVVQLRGHLTSVVAVAFTPESGHLVSADGDDSVIVWDVVGCVPVVRRQLRREEGISDVVCWGTEDVRTFVAVAAGRASSPGQAGSVLLWSWTEGDAAGMTLHAELGLAGPRRWPTALAVSDDHRRLAAGDSQGAVHVWYLDADQITASHEFAVSSARVNQLTFLDGAGEWLAIASGDSRNPDRAIRVWSVGRRAEVPPSPYVGHEDTVLALALNAEGNLIASGSRDDTVLLWSLTWHEGAPRLSPKRELRGHSDDVTAVAFCPCSQPPRLASASRDRSIKIWDVDTGVESATLRGHTGWVRDLAFDPQARRLASASSGSFGTDNVVWVWEALERDEKESQARTRAHRQRAYYEVQHAVRGAPSLTSARRYIEQLQLGPAWQQGVAAIAAANFETFVSRPDWLNAGAWDIASRSDASAAEYEQALGWAHAAFMTAPWDSRIRSTLGALQYRCGRYVEAAQTLELAGPLNNRHPLDDVFLGMAYHQLGQLAQARAHLALARQRCANEPGVRTAEVERLLREAEQLLDTGSRRE